MKRATRHIICTILLALAALAAGCSDDSPLAPTPEPKPAKPAYTLYVDQAAGNDGNSGTQGSPLKTITAALAVADTADSAYTVYVAPGTYGTGETFPMRLPAGTKLIGDTASRGTDPAGVTEIVGSGPFTKYSGTLQLVYKSATIVGADGAEVIGFRIAPGPGDDVNIGVAYTGAGPGNGVMRISRNTFETHYLGAYVDSAGAVDVDDNTFGPILDGVTVRFSDGALFRNNRVRADRKGIDLGIGPADQLTISNNTFEISGSNGYGVYAQLGAPLITGNRFSWVGTAGIPHSGVLGGGGAPVLRGNQFAMSPAIFAWNAAQVDVGTAAEPGNNDFTAVPGVGIDVRGFAHVTAYGNLWNHTPPRYGIDVVISENGSVDMALLVEYWVDVQSGDDANDGTEASPFQTITAALAADPQASTIYVAPGTYGPLETFPLVMHDGLSLVGDTANRGNGPVPTLVQGEGPHNSAGFDAATIVGAPHAEVAGLKITTDTDPFGYFGLMVDEGPMTVRRNTFAGGYGGIATAFGSVDVTIADNVITPKYYGAYTHGSAASVVSGNEIHTSIPLNLGNGLITGNQIYINMYTGAMQANGSVRIEGNTFYYERQYGLDMTYAAILVDYDSPVIRNNTFHTDRGIMTRSQGAPDLGTAVSPGGNDFANTSICGIEHGADGITVDAIGNTWVNDPPQVGVDIIITGTGSVVTSAP